MIDGVIIKKIDVFSDKRGNLWEIYRSDFDKVRSVMAYASHTEYGAIRGPHEHTKQTDFFAFIGYGDFELHLWDNRIGSKTYGIYEKLTVGKSNKVSVSVPPGVVHGYKSVTKGGSFSINLPDRLYAGKAKKEKVDEIRYENKENSNFIIK